MFSKRNKTRITQFCTLISCLLVVVLLSSGCQPLKKKFTRKKKGSKKAEEFIPVLDPIDYGPTTITSKDRYKKHYSLWRIWEKDFVKSYAENANKKRLIYLLDQMTIHLKEMKRWLVEEKRKDLDEYILVVIKARKDLDRPPQMISLQRIANRIDRSSKKLILTMKPDLMEEFYVK